MNDSASASDQLYFCVIQQKKWFSRLLSYTIIDFFVSRVEKRNRIQKPIERVLRLEKYCVVNIRELPANETDLYQGNASTDLSGFGVKLIQK